MTQEPQVHKEIPELQVLQVLQAQREQQAQRLRLLLVQRLVFPKVLRQLLQTAVRHLRQSLTLAYLLELPEQLVLQEPQEPLDLKVSRVSKVSRVKLAQRAQVIC